MKLRTPAHVVVVAAALMSVLIAPAHGAEVPYATGPASFITGFTEPVLALPAGSSMTFTNFDVSGHNVVSLQFGSDGQSWCAEQQYTPGQCPLFWSPVIGTGATSAVYGIELIQPGQIYQFVCEPHASVMKGTLVALPGLPV